MSWIITWHWTAGAYGVNPLEEDAYHFIIGSDGKVTKGIDSPEDNIPPLKPGAYAASTLNRNSWNISIAVDAMAGAVERPFNPGRAPITQAQVDALVALTAKLAAKYNIPIIRTRILSHAEVQPTLGIRQRNKWDITWLPGMKAPGNPVEVGDRLRKMVVDHKSKVIVQETQAKAQLTPPPKTLNRLQQFINKVINIFRGS